MTLAALHWDMLSKQGKFGLVMIKVFHFPSGFGMAILALLTFRAFVHVIALVTRVARGGRQQLRWRWWWLVASLALSFNVLTF